MNGGLWNRQDYQFLGPFKAEVILADKGFRDVLRQGVIRANRKEIA